MTGSLFIKTKRNVLDFGIFNTSLKIFKELLGFIYESRALIIYELDLLRNYTSQNIPGLHFVMLKPDDSSYISQIEKMEEWLENKLKKRLTENGLCIVALANGQVVGFNLIVFEWIELPLLKIRVYMKNDEAWSEQISVKKEFRKMGIANEMRKIIYEILKKRGICKLYGHRADYNHASKMSARKFTKNEITFAKYVKLLRQEKIEFVYSKSFQNITSVSFNGADSIRDENRYLILKTAQLMHFGNHPVSQDAVYETLN
jgi:GNAT superfamily N-acetyltransferase